MVDPEEEVGLSSRSRPGHLRQRPRARYNDQLDDLGLSSSDDEPLKPRGRRTWAAELSEESEAESEADKADPASTPADPGTPAPAAAAAAEEEAEATNSPAPQPQEGLSRARQKNPRTRRGGKKVFNLLQSPLLKAKLE